MLGLFCFVSITRFMMQYGVLSGLHMYNNTGLPPFVIQDPEINLRVLVLVVYTVIG